MTNRRLAAFTAAGALALGGTGVVVANQLSSSSTAVTTTTAMGCENYSGTFTQKECFGAGIIRNVSFHNLQGAAQFCKWRDANPGEWSRIKQAALTGTTPSSIITWLGGHIWNDLQAYQVLGGPPFTILPNTAPNACKGQTLAPPVISGVTPGQTDATVTIDPNG